VVRCRWRDRIFVSPYCRVAVPENLGLPAEVFIDDATLREGEQSPGVVFSPEDKVRIAELLTEVGVDCIEAGFPASSEADFRAVANIASMGLGPRVYGFSRAVISDIDAVAKCDCDGIVLSFPPSDIHIKYKLRMTREQYLERAIQCVEHAKSYGLEVVYSAEDSTRTELDWLLIVFRSTIQAGVDRVRVVDTLGCITPSGMAYLVKQLRPLGKPIEVHCHNDHGLALANSLAAYEAGATYFSTAVLGLGERAGIAATEELIVAVHNLYGVEKYRLESLSELCRVVSKLSGMPIWPSKPIVGENVFVHTSGIHQNAVLKDPLLYECFPPEMVGQRRRFLLSKVSGRAAVRAKLKELGFEATDENVTNLTWMVKEISSSRRSAITDEEFRELARRYFESRSR